MLFVVFASWSVMTMLLTCRDDTIKYLVHVSMCGMIMIMIKTMTMTMKTFSIICGKRSNSDASKARPVLIDSKMKIVIRTSKGRGSWVCSKAVQKEFSKSENVHSFGSVYFLDAIASPNSYPRQ